MNWELKHVDDTEWVQDNSGYYTLIHYVKDDIVRIDFMDKNDMPVISFQGTADNVRKHAIRFAEHGEYKYGKWLSWYISLEHASYIGAELARCAIFKENYVQD